MFCRARMLNSSIILEQRGAQTIHPAGPTHLLSERHQAGHWRHTGAQPHLQKCKGTLSGIGCEKLGLSSLVDSNVHPRPETTERIRSLTLTEKGRSVQRTQMLGKCLPS